MDKSAKVYVAGHRGLVGSAIVRCLNARGYANLLTRSRAELDLSDRRAVNQFFESERPDYVFLAAAKVGGIAANSEFPADFIRDNLLIQTHVIDAAYRFKARKLLFLGSSCIYPKFAEQPIREQYLLTGELEPTNSAYAVAKIAGIEMCRSYRKQFDFPAISVMPTNLYGINDNFDLSTSHVLPALIRKFHEAAIDGRSEVVVWGTGTPKREFLFVDDLADACVFLMDAYDGEDIVNVGVGQDVSIRELAELIASIVGYRGAVVFDTTKPDGTPRKLLDVSRLSGLGWRASTSLEEGIRKTYAWYRSQQAVSSVL